MYFLAILLSNLVFFAPSALGEEINNTMELLPYHTVSAINVRPNQLSGKLKSDFWDDKIANEIDEIGLSMADLVQYTSFIYINALKGESLKKVEPKSLKDMISFGGVILNGNFANTKFDKLKFYVNYAGHDIYFSNKYKSYYVKLGNSLAVSDSPEIVKDVIDVYIKRSYSFKNKNSRILKKLKNKIRPNSPVSVITVMPEAWSNILNILKTVFNLGDLTVGFSHYLQITVTLDGSQFAKGFDVFNFEGSVVNIESLHYREYYNINLLYPDTFTANLLSGMFSLAVLVQDDSIEETDVRTDKNFAIIDVVTSYKKMQAPLPSR